MESSLTSKSEERLLMSSVAAFKLMFFRFLAIIELFLLYINI